MSSGLTPEPSQGEVHPTVRLLEQVSQVANQPSFIQGITRMGAVKPEEVDKQAGIVAEQLRAAGLVDPTRLPDVEGLYTLAYFDAKASGSLRRRFSTKEGRTFSVLDLAIDKLFAVAPWKTVLNASIAKIVERIYAEAEDRVLVQRGLSPDAIRAGKVLIPTDITAQVKSIAQFDLQAERSKITQNPTAFAA